MTKGILIAGTHSGVGKTTVSMGIMAALKHRQLKVQPYKVGPDYIDPSHHTAICGRPSRNLDTYLMGTEGVRQTVARTSADADIAVVEGVMGLFDGIDSTEVASSAHVAKTLDIPVILVINVHGMSRSAAALLKGYSEFDPEVRVAGVILNQVGSPRHAELVKNSLPGNIPIIGTIPRRKDIEVPSRHLGLYMAHEKDYNTAEMAAFIEENVDLDAVLELAEPCSVSEAEVVQSLDTDLKIGVAWDPAFCFYYRDMFDAFRDNGGEVVFFSPMTGEVPDVDGIYLGGGYPELYAETLENSETTQKLKGLAADGLPIYAECGGLLYLCGTYEVDDRVYKLADVVPANTRMTNRLKALGYTEARPLDKNFSSRNIRGHEFHYSITECDRDAKFAYEMIRGKGVQDGFDGLIEHNTLAGYMHSHPASFPVDKFVQKCREYRKR
ncbi:MULTISPECIES: cobyrinate a,c-diamide synthase [Methanosarcina]|uniref:Cobyrinate a,c-diamide synthase n=3 Tax=Methanosarcina mazei TaxID=2209 RepID=A0A0F8JHL1_METMZ|nr:MULTISPECIES: cobyrinate a,c-diamide synthase [Methanosarcina]AGF96824.1 Cobyrinic acid A,C-diamide synthase [Methanosarcina mazei Tuc01]AKB63120.1 Cobyrinic acid A,C-diamide synthase [Methanosarcina mazei SarPi]KKG68315.1 cobyrinic acid a,c-diamide synthase [Methanosarcina mazei]QIB92580.1 cobyrinate a,c-diamide synthase [Methanosarcina mazei]